jgi:hypothetical protein
MIHKSYFKRQVRTLVIFAQSTSDPKLVAALVKTVKYIKVETSRAKQAERRIAQALRMLDIVDRFDPLAEDVAKEVVDAGTSGATDPREIAKIAVGHFRKTLS